MIKIENIHKNYRVGQVDLEVLRGISLSITQGEFVSIMGPSGSGKSTLMNILGCLDTPSSGKYCFEGRPVDAMDDDQLSDIRNRTIGFVFQSFHLIKYLTVAENVKLPMEYLKIDDQTAEETAGKWLDLVGLSHRTAHLPAQLSGGERQRVAIARALANDPNLILADEPTGNLDSKSSFEIMRILKNLNQELGKTIVIITHSEEVAGFAGRSIKIRDGLIC
ncbi:MAG: ABC transporter ATP-binding protein [Candidatus Wallbacteria bacterium]|nr:ABC transporter ATP-binding protein [Candidatus Wallbacteria bacterium]